MVFSKKSWREEMCLISCISTPGEEVSISVRDVVQAKQTPSFQFLCLQKNATYRIPMVISGPWNTPSSACFSQPGGDSFQLVTWSIIPVIDLSVWGWLLLFVCFLSSLHCFAGRLPCLSIKSKMWKQTAPSGSEGKGLAHLTFLDYIKAHGVCLCEDLCWPQLVIMKQESWVFVYFFVVLFCVPGVFITLVWVG
jgi:hypothetical protein